MTGIQEIALDQIFLNPKNPRFAPVKDQAEAIDTMLTMLGPEIKNLAIDIAENGLNPARAIIVCRHGTRLVALDGNRRVICLLLLHHPAKAKNNDMRKFFNALHKKYSKNVRTTVPCSVVESEEVAERWVMLEHTGKNNGIGTTQWGAKEKARFQQTHAQPQHQARFYRAYQILEYSDKEKISHDGVSLSSLDRLLHPDIRTKLGIDFPNKTLAIDNKTTFSANLRKIFQEMSKDTFKVKDIYRKSESTKWFDNVVRSEAATQKPPPGSTPNNKSPTRDKSTDRSRLIPNECDLSISVAKIHDIFLELRDDLPLGNTSKSTPNAVGVLFRVFLEVSIDHYLKTISGDIDQKLRQKINAVTKYMIENNIADKKDLSAICQTSSGDSKDVLHIDRFHELVHSTTISPLSRDLKENWNRLEGFMVLLWNDVAKRTPS